MIETFKIVTGRDKVKMEDIFECIRRNSNLRGHWSPVQDDSPEKSYRYPVKFFFSQRVVNISGTVFQEL